MIVEIYDSKKMKYKVTEMELDTVATTDDMERPIQCPNCKKMFPFGDGITSHKYYFKGGVFGMSVCPKCYEEEE